MALSNETGAGSPGRPLRVAIVPAGIWGTALAVPLSQNGHWVSLWFRKAPAAEAFNEFRENQEDLPGVKFPGNVRATPVLAEALEGAELVVLAPATHGLRDVCRLLAPLLRPGTGVLSACKGLEPETLLRMTQVIAEEIPPSCLPRVAALSGPNFAVEVGHGLPTATVVASEDPAVGRTFQDALMTPRFRVYTNRDVVGVELGGALKNVIAIGVGIAEGLEVGYNAQAALITRGLAEIARLGTAVGAQPLTFSGLSGMGDLVLTCTGELSRNRRVGIDLGRGKTLDQATAGGRVVAEGVRTTRAAYSLSQQLGIRMPITEQVYHVLFNGRDPREGVMALMCRGKNTEVDE